MDMRGTRRGEHVVNVALAVGDHGHLRRLAQNPPRGLDAVDPTPAFALRDRPSAIAQGRSPLARTFRLLLALLGFLLSLLGLRLANVEKGVGKTDEAPGVPDAARAALSRIHHNHRMKKYA